uniref:Cytochrome c oxidase assembly factor 6 n=1 Tax=Kalanchoe fedtschenkoi TaxID=63787 RepID=A0A7N0TY18_KALFE
MTAAPKMMQISLQIACYKARDAFYSCLEKECSKEPTEVATVGLLYPAECKKSRAEFEKQCRRSWVKHFDRDYCAKNKVQRLLDAPNEKRGEGIK